MRDSDIISDDDLHRFARQLILSGFDESHQHALFMSHVVVIGAGGLGAPLLQFLGAAGVGRLSIFDDDEVDLTNLNRQIIHSFDDIGTAKVQSATEWLSQFDSGLHIHARRERFDEHTSGLDGMSVLCDASDNGATRYGANRVAHRLGVPLIFGGAVRMEGQLAVFRSGVDKTAPCYECIFPESAGSDLALSCAEAGILGAITGILGSMMALEAIRHCLIRHEVGNPLGAGLGDDLLLFDGRMMRLDRIKTQKNEGCPCCGDSEKTN